MSTWALVQNWQSFARRRDDHQLLDAALEEAARVEPQAEPAERPQDLRSKAHGLEHLDRRLAALPQAAALVEGGIVLDGLERLADLLGCDGDAQRSDLLQGRAAYGIGRDSRNRYPVAP